ncbi:hypothetical protein AMTR_s00005p00256560 [Amborella trichopoda]|uniref:Uncharacterized protein n=1 Tax=Amborella trichopoda TaxID=13333 RepID=W1PG21_AMBTC|nr:hypothetical protein AMTR_s00005p00256560 [Amborella trichopoda]
MLNPTYRIDTPCIYPSLTERETEEVEESEEDGGFHCFQNKFQREPRDQGLEDFIGLFDRGGKRP